MSDFLGDDDEDAVIQSFPAIITNAFLETTGTYAGLWMYDWVQQDACFTAINRIDANPPAEGKYVSPTSYSAAIHINNQQIGVGSFVILSPKCNNGDVLYQFDSNSLNGDQVFAAQLNVKDGSSPPRWKFTKLKLDSSGTYVADGAMTAGYYAVPFFINGDVPAVGSLVLMLKSSVLDGSGNPQFEFGSLGYASSLVGGLVSATTQTFTGNKTFEDNVFINTLNLPASTLTTPTFTVGAGDLSYLGSPDYPPTVLGSQDSDAFTGGRVLTVGREVFYSTGSGVPSTTRQVSLGVGGSIFVRKDSSWGSAGAWPLFLISGSISDFWFTGIASWLKMGMPFSAQQTDPGTGTRFNVAQYAEMSAYASSGTPPALIKSLCWVDVRNITYDTLGYVGLTHTNPLRYCADGFSIFDGGGGLPVDGVGTSSTDCWGQIYRGGILIDFPTNGANPQLLVDSAAGLNVFYYSNTGNFPAYKDYFGAVHNLLSPTITSSTTTTLTGIITGSGGSIGSASGIDGGSP